MAAKILLDWEELTFKASEVTNWRTLKKAVNLNSFKRLQSDRAVYVIRVCRPYSFAYGDRHSPVAYIGKGQAQERLTAHFKSWMRELAKTIPEAVIKIYFCEPKAPYYGTVCEGVEADLIDRFVERYGSRPLRNRNTPRHDAEFTYQAKQLSVLWAKGKGYKWALRPLPSSSFYRAV